MSCTGSGTIIFTIINAVLLSLHSKEKDKSKKNKLLMQIFIFLPPWILLFLLSVISGVLVYYNHYYNEY